MPGLCTKGRSRRPRHRQAGLQAIPAKTLRVSFQRVAGVCSEVAREAIRQFMMPQLKPPWLDKSHTDRHVLLLPAYSELSEGHPAAGVTHAQQAASKYRSKQPRQHGVETGNPALRDGVEIAVRRNGQAEVDQLLRGERSKQSRTSVVAAVQARKSVIHIVHARWARSYKAMNSSMCCATCVRTRAALLS